jgi:hypothetical protein
MTNRQGYDQTGSMKTTTRTLRTAMAIGTVLALTACQAQVADLGGKDGGGGSDSPTRSGDSSTVTPRVDVCKGAGAKGDGGAGDTGGPIQLCTASSDCTAPEVCIMLPGSNAQVSVDGGGTAPEGHCGAACETDCDCPAWLSCKSGLCSQCAPSANEPASECPLGQICSWLVTPESRSCSSNDDCSLGNFCDFGNCTAYEGCTACTSGNNCPTCTTNSQCDVGQVCADGKCTTCSSDSQCGPSAKCSATHTAVQCTCSGDAGCASDEMCSSGICTAATPSGCGGLGIFTSCPTGQACIAGACGACATFADCNNAPYGSQPQSPSGFACIDGVCKPCTSNSQCGGGEACVGGTCGTCATNEQCGPSGDCFYGFCICTTDGDCAEGQRCGAGVCVEL